MKRLAGRKSTFACSVDGLCTSTRGHLPLSPSISEVLPCRVQSLLQLTKLEKTDNGACICADYECRVLHFMYIVHHSGCL